MVSIANLKRSMMLTVEQLKKLKPGTVLHIPEQYQEEASDFYRDSKKNYTFKFISYHENRFDRPDVQAIVDIYDAQGNLKESSAVFSIIWKWMAPAETRSKEQLLLDKIKYLNKKYEQRKTQHV